MDFPFTFNSFASDYYEGIIDGFPFPYDHFIGHIDILADSYGTLILPNNTIDNVLKLSNVDIRQNSHIPADTFYFDTWYCPDIPYPVLEIRYNSNGFYPIAYYLDDKITHTEIIQANNDPYKIYPNPCRSYINLKWNIEIESVGVRIMNQYGTDLFEKKRYLRDETIDMSHFPEGVYYIEIKTSNESCTKMIVKN